MYKEKDAIVIAPVNKTGEDCVFCREMSPLEDLKPLTAAVKEVAIHQAEGYSHLTATDSLCSEEPCEA